MMRKASRRHVLTAAAAVTAASLADTAPAAAQAGPKPIFPVPMVTIPRFDGFNPEKAAAAGAA
jgi:fumarylpyruvate hydrolase